MTGGYVPCDFKESIVCPLLKKLNLDPNIFKNYRPVSNLPFLSKVLERVVLSQTNEHLSKNKLIHYLQSAYKAKHSTESALLKVMSDLLNATDEGNVSVLALLDLSSAFDTIDHDILLKRLHITFGFDGTVLKWFTSYLQDRSQRVKVKSFMSTPTTLKYGVPQGSVLGPILFSLYIQPLSEVIDAHNFKHHMYADDGQLYKSVPLIQVLAMLLDLDVCVSSADDWMHCNKLKQNNEKTEIMLTGTRSMLDKIDISKISLKDTEITLSSKVKDLGVIIDNRLTMDLAVSHVRKVCYLELRKIAHLRPVLSEESTTRLVMSFVLSRLDYSNSLFCSITLENVNKLQQIQNHAARLIKRVSKRHSATSLLKDLHWLPVKARIEYKIALMVYQCLYESQFPKYLKDMITPYIPAKCLRSSHKNLLEKPIPRLKTYGERAFTFTAPNIWNGLPEDIKSSTSVPIFKKKLKTHLFRQYLC